MSRGSSIVWLAIDLLHLNSLILNHEYENHNKNSSFSWWFVMFLGCKLDGLQFKNITRRKLMVLSVAALALENGGFSTDFLRDRFRLERVKLHLSG